MYKMLCPFHEEKTPSLVVYPDGYRCYGCGATGPLSKLGLKDAPKQEKHYEDIEASLSYIRALPTENIRGLPLHCDDRYYYLLWRDAPYYKRRCREAESGSKYRCPSGHAKPLFWASRGQGPLYVVEGEINAMSIALAMPQANICSPGGVGDFTRKEYLTELMSYDIVKIVADQDDPGAVGAIKLKMALMSMGKKHISITLMSTDANQILIDKGKDALKEFMSTPQA